MSSTNKNISIAKADIYVRPYGTTGGFRNIGDCEAGNLGITTTTTTVKGNGKAGGVVFEDVSIDAVTLNLTLRDLAAKNLALAMASPATSKVAGSKTETITLAVGESYLLEGFDVAITSFGTFVEDDDYTLDATTGLLTALTAITAQSITYDYEAFTELGIAVGTSTALEVIIEQAKSNKVFRLWKWNVSPAAQYDFISSGNITTLALTGSCISDSSRPADATLGQTGKVKVKDLT